VASALRLRPAPRPDSPQMLAVLARPADLAGIAPLATLRPAMRSPEFVQQVLFGRAKRRRGSVCGDLDIQGEEAGDIAGTLQGCGARDAVRVRSVSGVALSTPALMTCDTAKALNSWVSRDVEKAFGRANRVVRLRVAAHYSCRTRNNRPGAKISEHGRGRAIDISGFTLADGTLITVLKGWQSKSTRGPLRRLWKSACGPFRTVLGPEADSYHRDHFHLDTARHRSGRYCR
ncbi:extensin family protein, partial [Phaeobacter sp. HF9A]|uniref:extensin-like domain-containing protein n=1 Tax=Phaeobacter sp. HF9A TaxID=2721561 RepID=UPI00143181FA